MSLRNRTRSLQRKTGHEVVRGEREATIDEVCETLRAGANARAVLLHALPLGSGAPVLPLEVWEDENGVIVYTTQVKRSLLVVKFHRDESSLGLVRLRARRAVAELERLLGDLPGTPPIGGSGGPSGIPHELRVVEPIPAERPKPKPTPIGRRKKR